MLLIFLVIALIKLLESFFHVHYMYPLTNYAPGIIKELFLTDSSIDNKYSDRIKAAAFVLVYGLIVAMFNLLIGYILGHLSHILSIKYTQIIVVAANTVIFLGNLYSFIALTKNNKHSISISAHDIANTILCMFFMLMERMIPQIIGCSLHGNIK
jgi:ABC-type dipeptide/oligopeptide/nickel transport system permease subunit